MPEKKKRPPTYSLDESSIAKLETFRDDFLSLARRHFGEYMQNVVPYVEKSKTDPVQNGFTWATFPEDFYYAELAQIAVLNESLWDDFAATTTTIIFIPDCLSLMQVKCKRFGEKPLEKCAQCVPNCMVNKIVELKAKYDFEEVFAYREQTEQFKFLKEKYESLGFIGIACILMLADGLRTSMYNGIPAVGVPLKFCGCEHWAEEPFPTDTFIGKIEEILRAKRSA